MAYRNLFLMAMLETHFWLSSFPVAEGVLFLTASEGEGEAEVLLHDCDGARINQFTVKSEAGDCALVELDPFLEMAKVESGLRHLHLIVRHTDGYRPLCRMHNRGGAAIIAPLIAVDPERAAFFPVTLSATRDTVLALVNKGDRQAVARVRMSVGTKTHEAIFEIRPFATTLVELSTQFASALPVEAEGGAQELRSYVRISSRAEQPLGIQLVEFIDRAEQGTAMSGVSA